MVSAEPLLVGRDPGPLKRPKLAIFGSTGRLGTALSRIWREWDGAVPLTRRDCDLGDPSAIGRVLRAGTFDGVVNCAALADVDACERDPDLALAINAAAPRVMAQVCADLGIRLVHLSTDYVFDGKKTTPYSEGDEAAPISSYGRSKRAGEIAVLAVSPGHIVARVSWLFGPDKANFVDTILQRAAGSAEIAAIADKTSVPTYTEDLAPWLAAFFDRPLPGGIYHLCNTGACSWQEYGAHALAEGHRLGFPLRATEVRPQRLDEMGGFLAPRAPHTAMSNEKFAAASGFLIRPWREAVTDYLQRKLKP